MNVIGTCSICGGAVCTPSLWAGIVPPEPSCSRCGAVAANHGPIIPMVKRDTGGEKWTTTEYPSIEFPMTQTFNPDVWKAK